MALPLAATLALGGGSMLSGIFSSSSARKTAREQMALSRENMKLQKDMFNQTMQRADKFVDESKGDYQRQRKEVDDLHSSTRLRLEEAYKNQDQALVQKLENELANIEQQQSDLTAQIQQNQGSANDIINQQETGAINDVSQGQADAGEIFADGDQAIDQAYNNATGRFGADQDTNDRSLENIGNVNEGVSGEFDRIVNLGGRPEGLDAATTDLESGFRDAENEMVRRSGGPLTDAQKLNLEMNKARGKGNLSRDMREDWSKYRTSAIGNLGQNAANLNATEMGLRSGLRNEQNTNDQMNLGNLMAQNQSKLSSGERFLDRKLRASEDAANKKLAANETAGNQTLNTMQRAGDMRFNSQSGSDAQNAANEIDRANSFIQNNRNRVAGNDAALNNLNNVKNATMGVTSNAATNMANAYGNMAAQNQQNAMLANQQGQNAISNAIGNLGTIYGMYKEA